jgi:bZIP factor
MMSERIKKIKPVPADKKDDAYWERRRKNNEAAKRSRDLRRQKEDEIAVRASFLEQENLKLKAQVTILKAELSKLHFMLYNR